MLTSLSHSSSDLWIPSISCTSAACNTHTKYDPSLSSTSKSVPQRKLSISYGDGSSTSGSVWTDTVSIAGLTAAAQTFGAANSLSSDWQDDPMDGESDLSRRVTQADLLAPPGMLGMAYASISQIGTAPFFNTVSSDPAEASPHI